ncbi:MAG: ATP-dependent zinc metalloprotease FtsH [Candidatus Fermentibacter daniensis]|jgi:cell division protease FtsH|nr:MAG: cell division protein FtsH [Candidatus Fermentibacter daniensis]MBP7719403.1 ATP-dependent zinc metalloprotease FtsH [Candidatus Fermentibacter sp.]KZD19986.1 MAG: cell division protein FtsH [Candidatus Fermentibacter daniensis]NLI02009.1 ATP-dependent metallopeptidase FtsH/Yme1/Tma family protein [Candidatus Fermentibacter daniensis]HOA05299.1 ATP-dependent zinc metalloprotease FtsH [Candidatus Fermentibacter daniensis]
MTDNKPPEKPGLPPVQFGCSFRTLTLWILVILLVYTVFSIFQSGGGSIDLPYTSFLDLVSTGRVESVVIETGGSLSGEFFEPVNIEGVQYERFTSFVPLEDRAVIDSLQAHDVRIVARPPRMDFLQIVLSIAPIMILIGFWVYFMRNAGGGGKAFSFGRSRARLFSADRPKTTFADVAGVEEAKEELREIIEFLKSPRKFQRLGGKVPRGVLLVGPPGTGKTLLAKAVAGEAEVPFFSMSGSDFVEMFVGVGASRVRDLFAQGKAKAPCIIFIDEIDAVGRHRGAVLGGGHDEREQTLNALLVEMDGFESNEGVIVMAATNRPDVLDPALLRPGRFDRNVMVSMPDVKGREAILRVHTRKMPLDKGVTLEKIARATPGFSGADLESLANEAALRAARRNLKRIEQEDFEYAIDRIVMGIERRSMVISPEEKRLTAFHETGHALVSMFIPGMDPVHKVTIVPRGRALGVTSFLPLDDRHNYSLEYCRGVLARLLGGRAAETIFLDTLSTGAGNDLDKATALARRMVCEWGMSSSLGPVTLGETGEPIFLGRDMGRIRNYSEHTARLIDDEIKSLLDEAYVTAEGILREHEDLARRMTEVLLEQETLSSEEINALVRGNGTAAADTAPDADSDKEGIPGDDGSQETADEPEEDAGADGSE